MTRCSPMSSAPPRRREPAQAGRAAHSGTRRWRAAVIGGYLDGENAWQTASNPIRRGSAQPRRPRLLPMDRWLRFSGTGAHRVARQERRGIRPVQDPAADGRIRARPAAGKRLDARRRRRTPAAPPSVPPGYGREAGHLHRADPHPQRPHESHPDPAPHHPPDRTWPRRGTRRLDQKRWLMKSRSCTKRTVRGARRVLRGRSAAWPARKHGRCSSRTT